MGIAPNLQFTQVQWFLDKMLDKTGDLIPVRSEAVNIPWTKRKSQVLNFIHRGMVKFETHVYDTNVGDISPLSSYFNPQRWTVKDLNEKFGIQTQNPDLSVGVDTSPGSGAGSDNPSTIVDINDKEESQLEDKTGSTIRTPIAHRRSQEPNLLKLSSMRLQM